MSIFRKPILLVLAVFFCLYLFLILRLHFNYSTTDSDLGIYDQQIWFLSQFKLAPSSFKNGFNAWGDHFGLIEIFIAPIYWLWTSSVVLLILQVLSVVLSALPIYWLFKKRLKTADSWAIVFVSGYLLYFGFQAAIIFPFHLATLSVVFISFLIYGLLEEKWLLYWSMLFLTLITKEDLPLLGLVIGVYLLLRKKYLIGFLTFTLSGFYFYLVTSKIIPFFVGGPYSYFVSALGNTPVDIIINSIKNPFKAIIYFVTPLVKLRTMIAMFASFSFLTLFSPTFLLFISPFLAERFLNDTLQRHLPWMHYSVTQGPLLAYGALFGLLNIQNFLKNYQLPIPKKVQTTIVPIAVVTMLAFSITITFFYKMPLLHYFNLSFYSASFGAKEVRGGLKLIPKSASVATQSGLQPHLSERDIILFYPDPARSTTGHYGDLPADSTPSAYLLPNVDYIILSTNAFHWHPPTKEGMIKQIDYVKTQKDWEVIYDKGGTVLFKRKS